MNTNFPSEYDLDVWLSARISIDMPVQFVGNDELTAVVRKLRYNVVETEAGTTVLDPEVIVEWVHGGETDWMDLAMFRRDMTAPRKFASTDEADHWLDEEAKKKRTWTDKELRTFIEGK